MSRLHCLAPFLPHRLNRFQAVMALALGVLAVPALGQDEPPPEYLVELALLEPVDARSDAWPIDELASFDIVADPALLRRFGESLRRAWSRIDWPGLPVPAPLGPRIGMLPSDEDGDDESGTTTATPSEPVERALPWLALEPPPSSLQDAVQRLTRDGRFRLVTREAWLQPSGTPRRPQRVRVRDETVVYLEPIAPADDSFSLPDSDRDNDAGTGRAIDAFGRPEAPIATTNEAPLQPWPGALDDETSPLEDPNRTDRLAEEPDASIEGTDSASMPPLPPVPKGVTRVDGTVALIQRQFLHIELDLHWREPIERPGPLDADRPTNRLDTIQPSMAETGELEAEPATPAPLTGPEPEWQVHRLTQSRVIRTDQWAYFDSDRFGVLIRATELPPLLPLPEPEPEPERQVDDALIDAMPDPSDPGGASDPDGA